MRNEAMLWNVVNVSYIKVVLGLRTHNEGEIVVQGMGRLACVSTCGSDLWGVRTVGFENMLSTHLTTLGWTFHCHFSNPTIQPLGGRAVETQNPPGPRNTAPATLSQRNRWRGSKHGYSLHSGGVGGSRVSAVASSIHVRSQPGQRT